MGGQIDLDSYIKNGSVNTRADAIAAISTLTPLTSQDLEGFLSCSQAEMTELVAAYRDANVMPSASAWDVVVAIVRATVDIANLVIPITGAITGVFGVIQSAK